MTGDSARLALTGGGTRLTIADSVVIDEPAAEYEGIYERFATLLDTGASDADGAPFKLALDALDRGERREVAPFHW